MGFFDDESRPADNTPDAIEGGVMAGLAIGKVIGLVFLGIFALIALLIAKSRSSKDESQNQP